MDFYKFRKTFKVFTYHEFKILKTDSQTRLQWHKACSVVNNINKNNFKTNVSLNGPEKVLERDEIINKVEVYQSGDDLKKSLIEIQKIYERVTKTSQVLLKMMFY